MPSRLRGSVLRKIRGTVIKVVFAIDEFKDDKVYCTDIDLLYIEKKWSVMGQKNE